LLLAKADYRFMIWTASYQIIYGVWEDTGTSFAAACNYLLTQLWTVSLSVLSSHVSLIVLLPFVIYWIFGFLNCTK